MIQSRSSSLFLYRKSSNTMILFKAISRKNAITGQSTFTQTYRENSGDGELLALIGSLCASMMHEQAMIIRDQQF